MVNQHLYDSILTIKLVNQKKEPTMETLDSLDLVSKVIGTLIGVINIVTLIITLVTKSHDPLSKP